MRYALIFLAALIGQGHMSVEAKDLTPREIYEQASPAVVMVMGHSDSGKGGSGGTGSIIQPWSSTKKLENLILASPYF